MYKESDEINYVNLTFKEKEHNHITSNNVFLNEELLLKPLYKKIELDPNEECHKVFPYSDYRLELFCPECKKRRIFNFQNSSFVKTYCKTNYRMGSDAISQILKNMDFFTLKALADCKHKLLVNFRKIDNQTIEKIGQYPSIYDMNENINNKPFLQLLNKEYAGYYKSANSLYSFNSCIGALTYLRRIFEKILIDAFNENTEQIAISFDEFTRKRMEEKIKVLEPHLPSLIYEQGFNTIYTKISDGIHNLSEDECEKIFPILKCAIDEILTDKLEVKEREKRRKEIATQLNGL